MSTLPGSWGYPAKNEMLQRAQKDAICFMDDDDIYTDNGLELIRARFETAPDKMHIFKMQFPWGDQVWDKPEMVEGEVASQTIVVPGGAAVGRFGTRYEGDFDFAASTAQLLGPPVWHDAVVCHVRPGTTEWAPGEP